MEKYYLFKRASDGKWIFGQNAKCEHPSGVARVMPSTDNTTITIIYITKREGDFDQYNIPVGSFYKENDSAYASFAELEAGYAGFFSNGSSILDSINTAIGAKSDESATTDTGSFSLISLTKRMLTKLTSLITGISDGSQISQIIAKRGVVTTTLNAITSTTTSAEIDLGDFEFIDLAALITGTGTWNVNIQGRFDANGTYMDLYDPAGNQISLGNISTSLMKGALKVPRYIKVVATEIVDGSTLTVRLQPVMIV